MHLSAITAFDLDVLFVQRGEWIYQFLVTIHKEKLYHYNTKILSEVVTVQPSLCKPFFISSIVSIYPGQGSQDITEITFIKCKVNLGVICIAGNQKI